MHNLPRSFETPPSERREKVGVGLALPKWAKIDISAKVRGEPSGDGCVSTALGRDPDRTNLPHATWQSAPEPHGKVGVDYVIGRNKIES